MTEHLDLHKELLELSDAIGRLNRRILDEDSSSVEVCIETRVLNDQYRARLEAYKKEKLRRTSESRTKANEQDL